MTFGEVLFWGFAAAAVLPAVGILLAASIVRMAFLLLVSLSGFAGMYLLLGAGFVGFTQVLVYIGGILVLFLFGVMLTERDIVPIRKKRPIALIIPEVCAGLLVLAAAAHVAVRGPWSAVASSTAAPGPAGVRELGFDLLSRYLVPFEAVSVLLLAAMVGATYIARGTAARTAARKGPVPTTAAPGAGVPAATGAGDGGRSPTRVTTERDRS